MHTILAFLSAIGLGVNPFSLLGVCSHVPVDLIHSIWYFLFFSPLS